MTGKAASKTILLFMLALLWLAWGQGAPCLALDPRKAITQYSHTVWQTAQGLPQDSVFSLCQTRDGYLWIGTWEGLARFDGARFVIFDRANTSAIKSNWVIALYEDRAGNLWFSTHDSGVVRYGAGVFTNFSIKDGLPSNVVTAFGEDREGGLWLGTVNGLSRFAGGQFTNYTMTDGLASNNIRSLYYDAREGALWIGTSNGLTRWRDGRFSVQAGAAMAGLSINAICAGTAGNIWLGTQRGLFQVHSDGARRFMRRDGLPNERIQSLAVDRNGNLWIGTYGGGLARYHDGRFAVYGLKEGLPGDVVYALMEDREGNLWAGVLDGGLNRFHDGKFTVFTTREGLAKDVINSLSEDASGGVWLGTSGAGVNLLKDGRVLHYPVNAGRANDRISKVYVDRRNRVWAISNASLQILQGRRFQPFALLASEEVQDVYEARDGRLWLSTSGGLKWLKDGRVRAVTEVEALRRPVTCMFEDRHGAMWFGALGGGLHRLQDGQFTSYSIKDGLPDHNITSLYEDREGVLWAATYFAGIARFKDGRFARLTANEGLYADDIFQILGDDSDRLWFSSNKGLFSVQRGELNEVAEGRRARVSCVVYDTADGLKSRECRTGLRARDGRLWYRTARGIAVIDPRQIEINRTPPPVIIEEMRVDRQPVALTKALRLAPDTRDVEFHYTGLSLVAPEKVRFKYRLEGYDREWIEAGTRRSAWYTNLPPGEYRFRVMACNNDGVWNEAGAQYVFSLAPRFYQTTWFSLVCAVAVALISVSLYRLKLRRVRTRFATIFAERNRIARELHDTLEQGLAMILLQVESGAARLQEQKPALSAVAHHLELARQLIKHSLAEARRSVWDLHAEELENNDLVSAVSRVAQQLTDGTNIQTEVSVNGDIRELPATTGHNLLRICQEAITNAVRHAQAQRIRVALNFGKQSIELCVADDGRGFDPDSHLHASGGHFGLLGMRERAEKLGGRLQLKSSAGQGTEVVISVPAH